MEPKINKVKKIKIPFIQHSYHYRMDSFKNSFFSWTIREWSRLDLDIGKSVYSGFRQHLHKLIRPKPSATFNVCNFARLRLLTRLRMGLSHLNEHRFKHNFQNCINLLCTCSLEVEPTSHFLYTTSNIMIFVQPS